MTANRGLFVRNLGTTGTTPIEGRLVLASLVAEQSPGVPRQGVLDPHTTTLVTGSASNMSYNVAACNPVLYRAAGEGVYMLTLTGTTNVVTDAAPGTGSRWDLVYVKQNDPDKGDASNTAVLGVHKGTAAASPVKPTGTLPAGAYVLAEVLVNAGAANAAAAGVSITQTWRYTALRGAPIPVRNTTERGELTPGAGDTVRRLDLGQTAIETYTGSVWKLSGVLQRAEFTGPLIGYPNDASQWGVGQLTVDGSAIKTMNNTFAQAGASDTVKILEAGIYLFEWNLSTTSLPPDGEMGIKNATTGEQFANDDLRRTKTWIPALSATAYAAANDIIQFYTFNRSGGFSGTNRVKVTKLA